MIRFFLWLFKGEKRMTKLTPNERTMFFVLQGTPKEDKQ